jgi:hypothetical protein
LGQESSWKHLWGKVVKCSSPVRPANTKTPVKRAFLYLLGKVSDLRHLRQGLDGPQRWFVSRRNREGRAAKKFFGEKTLFVAESLFL